MSARESGESLAPDHRGRSRGALTIGNKAIYPGQGPCRIGRVVKRVVEARVMMFYHLTVLDDNRGDLFVPVEKARAIGVRLLMKRSEIPKLLAHLRKTATTADSWKQRATDNMKLFSSGSPYDLAEVVASLTELGHTRSLTVGESVTLGKARKLLIGEISEVMGEPKFAVEEQIDSALKRKKTKET
ncbi:MAG: CarD family transcriptional regulator [Acidobacteriota bacterium]